MKQDIYSLLAVGFTIGIYIVHGEMDLLFVGCVILGILFTFLYGKTYGYNKHREEFRDFMREEFKASIHRAVKNNHESKN